MYGRTVGDEADIAVASSNLKTASRIRPCVDGKAGSGAAHLSNKSVEPFGIGTENIPSSTPGFRMHLPAALAFDQSLPK